MTQEKRERNKLILQYRKKGYTLRGIAKIVGISHERVRQVIHTAQLGKVDKKLTEVYP